MRGFPMRQLVIVLLAAVAFNASARDEKVDVAERRPFAEQAREVRAALDGEKYREIGGEDRMEVASLLTRMEQRLDEAGGVDRMRPQERVELFNDQERLNNILTSARRDSRQVCRREKATGTNRPVTRCRTVAERRRAQEQAREFFIQQRMPTMAPGS